MIFFQEWVSLCLNLFLDLRCFHQQVLFQTASIWAFCGVHPSTHPVSPIISTHTASFKFSLCWSNHLFSFIPSTRNFWPFLPLLYLGVEQSEAKFTDHLASGCGVRAGEVTAFPIPVSPKRAVVDMNSQQCCATFVHLRCSSVKIFHWDSLSIVSFCGQTGSQCYLAAEIVYVDMYYKLWSLGVKHCPYQNYEWAKTCVNVFETRISSL